MIGKDLKQYNDEIITLKDFKPKYPVLELIESYDIYCSRFKCIGMGIKQKYQQYLNYRVLSTCNYDDTKTTSVILLKQ